MIPFRHQGLAAIAALVLGTCGETQLYRIRDITERYFDQAHTQCEDDVSRRAYNDILPREIEQGETYENAMDACPPLVDRIIGDYEACMRAAVPEADISACFFVYGSGWQDQPYAQGTETVGDRISEFDLVRACFSSAGHAPIEDTHFEVVPDADISCKMTLGQEESRENNL